MVIERMVKEGRIEGRLEGQRRKVEEGRSSKDRTGKEGQGRPFLSYVPFSFFPSSLSLPRMARPTRREKKEDRKEGRKEGRKERRR